MTKRCGKALTMEHAAAVPDDAIDIDDMPERGEESWKNAALAPPCAKPNVGLCADEGAVMYLKAGSPEGHAT